MPKSLVAAYSSRQAASSGGSDECEWGKRTTAPHRFDYHSNVGDRYVEGLRDRVVDALASLGYPSLDAVDCEVAAGRVILTGMLPSYHLKQMAQVAALRVAGARRVDNQIVVTML